MTSTKYIWISPHGFANEGTLYSYDADAEGQTKEMERVIAQFDDDFSAVITRDPKGCDFRTAINIELAVHPERFRAVMPAGNFERI
jgi:hypothetical protein